MIDIPNNSDIFLTIIKSKYKNLKIIDHGRKRFYKEDMHFIYSYFTFLYVQDISNDITRIPNWEFRKIDSTELEICNNTEAVMHTVPL